MPFPNKQKKISDEGLELYLNRTATEHNGLTYIQFLEMMRYEVDKTKMAKAFGVKRGTIYRWLAVYGEEKQT